MKLDALIRRLLLSLLAVGGLLLSSCVEEAIQPETGFPSIIRSSLRLHRVQTSMSLRHGVVALLADLSSPLSLVTDSLSRQTAF